MIEMGSMLPQVRVRGPSYLKILSAGRTGEENDPRQHRFHNFSARNYRTQQKIFRHPGVRAYGSRLKYHYLGVQEIADTGTKFQCSVGVGAVITWRSLRPRSNEKMSTDI